MPDQTVHCVVERAAKLSEPTRKTSLHEPLAYDNAYAHSMRYRAYNDDGTEADLTGYSVVGAFTPSGHNTIKPLLNGTVSGNVAELILPSACYKHPGRFKFTMNLNKGSVSRSVLWVEGMVERNQTDTIEAPTEVLDVSQVITDAQTATANANAAVDRANNIANSLVNDSVNAITAAGTQQRQSVNDLGDQLKDYLEDHYGETTDKVAAKANRSSVSNVKHAIGADGQLNLTDALNEPAKKMTIHLEPKQDLHGYDHPWVGGAGKNLLQCNIQSGLVKGVNITVNTDGSITLNGESTELFYVDLTTDFDSTAMSGTIFTAYPDETAHTVQTLNFRISKGDRASLQDMARNGNVINDNGAGLIFAIRIPAGQSFTNYVVKPMLRRADEADESFEPYSNICPIEGYDTVAVTKTGKNLFSGIISRKTLDDNTGEESSVASNSITDFIKVEAGKTYTLSSKETATGSVRIFEYDKSKRFISKNQALSFVNNKITIQLESNNVSYIRMRAGSNVLIAGNQYQLEIGSIASDYEAYKGQILSLNVKSLNNDNTVYGGTVTVNEDGSGTLVVDRASVTLSGLDANKVSYSTSTKTFYITPNVAPGLAKKDYTAAFTGICDKFEPYPGTPAWSANTKPYIGYSSDLNFRFAIPGKTEVADVLDVLNGTTVTYYLATPTTYTLTAAQLQTLVGANHIWTDGTGIDLDYYADKYGLVDRLLAAFPKDTATGNPATFTDGADDLPLEKMEVAIEPKQDLHGYDHLWIGGAGKNLLGGFDDYSVYGIVIKDTANGISISGTFASGQTQFSYTLLNKILPTGTYVVNGVNGTGGSSYQLVITGGGMSGTKYGATNNTTFTSDGTTAVIVRLFVYSGGSPYNVVVPWQIESGTTPTTYEPYENICPITGWDKTTVTNFGANILDISDSSKDFITTLPAGTYTLKRFNSSSDTQVNSRIELLINNSYQYIISGEYDNGNVRVINGDLGWGTAPSQIITTKKEYMLRFLGSTKYALSVHNATLMMVPGTTVPTSYEPYNGSTILPVSLRSISGSTVYGGKLTVNRDGTGELVVDKACHICNGDESVVESAYTNCYMQISSKQNSFMDVFDIGQYGIQPVPTCSHYNGVAYSAVIGIGNCCTFYGNNMKTIGFMTTFENTSDFSDYLKKEYANGTPVTFVLPIANSKTYYLTAPQITTLLGTNRISCDAGEVTVTYHADPTLFITKKIAQALNA